MVLKARNITFALIIILVALGINRSLKVYNLDDDNLLLYICSEGFYDDGVLKAYFAGRPYLDEVRDKFREEDKGDLSREIQISNFVTRIAPEITNAYPGYTTLRYGLSRLYEFFNPYKQSIKPPHIALRYYFVSLSSFVILWMIWFAILSRVRDDSLISGCLMVIIILFLLDAVICVEGLSSHRFLPIEGVVQSHWQGILEFCALPGMRYGIFAYDGRTYVTVFLLLAMILRLDNRYTGSTLILSSLPFFHAAQGSAIVLGILAFDLMFRNKKDCWTFKIYAPPLVAVGFTMSLIYGDQYILIILFISLIVLLRFLEKSSLFVKYHSKILNALAWPENKLLNESCIVFISIVGSFIVGYIAILSVDDVWNDTRGSQLPARVVTSYRPVILLFCCLMLLPGIDRIVRSSIFAAREKFNRYLLLSLSVSVILVITIFTFINYYPLSRYRKDLIERCYELDYRVRGKESITDLDFTDSGENAVFYYDVLKGADGWFINHSREPVSFVPKLAGSESMGYVVGGTDNDFEHTPWMAFDNEQSYWAAKYRPTPEKPAIIEIELPEARIVNGYAIKTRADIDPCSPESWFLEASRDQLKWDVIDRQVNQFYYNPCRGIQGYKIASAMPYKWYRFQFTGSRGPVPDIDLEAIQLYDDISSLSYRWIFVED